MPYPFVATLRDDFNRGSLGSSWSVLWGVGLHIPTVIVEAVSGQNQSGDAGDASYKNDETFGPSLEAYASLYRIGSGSWAGIHMVQNPGSGTTDGYAVYVSWTSNNLRSYRIDNDMLFQLEGAVSYTHANGDKVGIDRDGTTLRVQLDTGSGFTEQMSRSDGTYATGTFYIALESSLDADVNGPYWDNLYAGTKTSKGLVFRRRPMMHMLVR